MKKNLLLICCLFLVGAGTNLKAQSFSVQHDTVTATVNGVASVNDYIINLTTSPITLSWHVTASNFPADWLTQAAFGVCDNNVCYSNGPDTHGHSMQLWNDTASLEPGVVFTTNPYGDTTTQGPFYLSLNLSGATTTGCHFVTITLTQSGVIGGSKTMTFIICKTPASTPVIAKATDNVLLYPNPANSEVNVVYDASADVKNIAIYNIIGKVLTVYRVTGSSANLNIENIPSGIYFARLYNSAGNVVATRKFTKQ